MLLRRANERGLDDHGWLRSFHTFSFADYYDPEHMGFRSLRVINDDRVAPGGGFPPHGHKDMEIVSYVLEGALRHEDSMGNGSVIGPGDVQRMSAGTGVLHSEYNASGTEGVHFLQIWILPDRRGLVPSYEQRHFPEADRRGRLRLVASPDGAEGSVSVHQDARILATLLGAGDVVEHVVRGGRAAWVHVARGDVEVGGVLLGEGDAAAITEPGSVALVGRKDAEVLVFDLS
jgi:redox-sensitive bicupin YhaK (pirin superfamily)